MLALQRHHGFEIVLRIFVSGIALHGSTQQPGSFLEVTL